MTQQLPVVILQQTVRPRPATFWQNGPVPALAGEGRSSKMKTLRMALCAAALSLIAVTGCEKSAPQNACTKNGATAEISGNHGHSVDIPADAIKRGIGGTYSVTGGDHKHVIALKDADMKQLQQAKPVKTRTSSVNGHVHEVEIKCK